MNKPLLTVAFKNKSVRAMDILSRLIRAAYIGSLICIVAACGGAPDSPPPASPPENVENPGASGTVSILYVSSSATQVTLAGQGGINSAVVTFQVVDENGTGIGGERVNFRLDSDLGGVSLIGNTTAVQTNSNGNVSVTLTSGTISTSVSVIATLDGTEKYAISEGINISTGVPVASKLDIAASPGWNTESTLDHNGVEVEIVAFAGDSFGNNAFNGVGISFWSPEMGTIEPSCILESGRCSVTWVSSGIRPSNHLVTIIAYTSGAEDFLDTNGNNLFDAGEAWVDLGEPYADENDNGVYDVGEYFVDSNKDGSWTPNGNGEWDGPCPDGSTGCTEDSSVIISVQGALILCPDQEVYDNSPPGTYEAACADAQ